MKIVRPRLTFTDSSLPLILEALGLKMDGKGYVTSEDGKKVHRSNIIGFQKDVGIITK